MKGVLYQSLGFVYTISKWMIHKRQCRRCKEFLRYCSFICYWEGLFLDTWSLTGATASLFTHARVRVIKLNVAVTFLSMWHCMATFFACVLLSRLQRRVSFIKHADHISPFPTFQSTTQHPSYGGCLEVKREYYPNCSVLGCVTQCSQSAAHSYEQFLQVQQIGFVTLGPLRHA